MSGWVRMFLGVVLVMGIAAGLAPWQVSAAQQPVSVSANALTAEQVAEEQELQELYPAYRDVDADYRHAGKEALEQWWDWKYGLRIHWGVYSMVGSNASWGMAWNGAQYKNDYNQLYKKFNPSEFDGDEWADLMVRGGMKYYIFTAKHHDGFAMWDTKTKVKKRVVYPGPGAADGAIEDCDLHYSIMETPFGRDIVKELVEATRRRGLGIGLYYSHWDWYDADFRWSGYDKTWFDSTFSPETDPEGWQRFLTRHREQVLELTTNYGPIDLLGWDCMINHPIHEKTQHPIWKQAWPYVKETVKMARRLQPGALMRQRGIYDYGDYFTPEGVIPANPADRKDHHEQRPWQVIYPCGTPSYVPNDGYKGADWILHSLIDITAKGGVFQVGFGPMPNGTFDERVVQRILYVGDWLKVNGEGIYKTRPWKHYEEGADIRYTRSKDGKNVYAISLKWPGETLALKKIKALAGTQIHMLGVDEPLAWRQDADQGLVIEMGDGLQDEANRPCKQAYVFRIKGEPLEEVAALP